MANLIIIEPSGKRDQEGWHYATIKIGVLNNGNFNEIKSWHCDSIHFHGNLNCDFEPNGKVAIWRYDDDIWVRESYGTNIYGGIPSIVNDGYDSTEAAEHFRLSTIIKMNTTG